MSVIRLANSIFQINRHEDNILAYHSYHPGFIDNQPGFSTCCRIYGFPQNGRYLGSEHPKPARLVASNTQGVSFTLQTPWEQIPLEQKDAGGKKASLPSSRIAGSHSSPASPPCPSTPRPSACPLALIYRSQPLPARPV